MFKVYKFKEKSNCCFFLMEHIQHIFYFYYDVFSSRHLTFNTFLEHTLEITMMCYFDLLQFGSHWPLLNSLHWTDQSQSKRVHQVTKFCFFFMCFRRNHSTRFNTVSQNHKNKPLENLNVLWDQAVQKWDKLFRWWNHDWASSVRWCEVLSGPLDRAPPSCCQQILKTETYVPWWGSWVSVMIGLAWWLYIMYNTSVIDTAGLWIRTIFQLFVHLDLSRVSSWHGTEPSAHLTITCLRVFKAWIIEITCFLCSKFWFWTTDENKRQNSSHTERLLVCIKASCAFENDPPDNYKEPHQLR